MLFLFFDLFFRVESFLDPFLPGLLYGHLIHITPVFHFTRNYLSNYSLYRKEVFQVELSLFRLGHLVTVKNFF